jgi:hypothetical protein
LTIRLLKRSEKGSNTCLKARERWKSTTICPPNSREGIMKIFGYGEDGLTYWALTTRLPNILRQLKDDTPPAECTFFFRPSFGRAGGPNSPQFGEFDAILGTKRAVYLIESKWDHVVDHPRPAVVLEEVQITRHRIFTWLRDRWHEGPRENWDVFRDAVQDDFTNAFPNRPLAPGHRLLARNLEYILRYLDENGFGEGTCNVLLYFHRDNVQCPERVVNANGQVVDTFTLVCVHYAALGQSGYFRMV